jgi:hypothetical protein
MKAILEFNLDNTEDVKAHLRCIKSQSMAFVLWTIKHNLFREFENNEKSMKVFDRINELMIDENLNIDELID